MAGDSTALKIDEDALYAAATALHQQHDDSSQSLTTLLNNLAGKLQDLAQYVPNVIDHARGEHDIIQKRGATLLGLFDDLATNLETVADETIPLHGHLRGAMGQID